MASRHRSPLSWSTLSFRPAAALGACITLLLAACTSTELPPEQPAAAPVAPAADVSPPFDVQAVIRRVSRSFRSEDGAFTGGQDTYAVRAGADGTFQFSARHAEGEKPIMGGPLKVRTTAISRGGQSLLRAARASVREDGELALARGPVVEVLRNGDEGLEQLWELASKPEGTGDLEVRVELAGLEYVGETRGGHHYVDRESGLGVRYGRATWVDANGVKTAVESVREGRALVMRVPSAVLEASAWPAVLDPIISSEISPDAPVPAFSDGAKTDAAIAHGDGIYLVVWTRSSSGQDILGTRVRASDGEVLDLNGIPLAVGTGEQTLPAVASSGSEFLVAWTHPVSFNDSDIRAVRVRGSDGGFVGSTLSISSAPLIQKGPAIAFDGANYFVVWDDSRSNASTDIYGARVRASDGVVLDTQGIPISTASSNQNLPSVAFDGSRYLVAWEDTRNEGGTDIYGARVGTDGGVLDTADLPISTATSVQSSPVVASAGGTFLVAWVDLRNASQADIYAARVQSSDGALLDAQGIPILAGPGTQRGVSVASDGSRFVLAWHHTTNFTNYDIHATRVGTDGVLLDATPVPLFASATNREQAPALAFDGSNFLVVWEDSAASRLNIFGARVRASDLSVLDTPPRLCSGQVNIERLPSVAAGANSYLVAWADSRDPTGSTDIHGVRVRASDGVVLDATSIPISVAPNTQYLPRAAFDGSNFLVVWQDARNQASSGTDVYGARVRESDGAVLDPEGLPLAIAPLSQQQPRVAAGEGFFFVAWQDFRTGSARVHGARVRASDGVILEPSGRALTSTTYLQGVPDVAYGGGSFLVVWHDSRLGSFNTEIDGVRVRAADGVVLDSAGLSVGSASENQINPAVAFDGSHFLVVWQDIRAGAGYDLYGSQVRAADGVVINRGGVALCTDASSQGTPSLAFDGSTYLMVWRDERNGVARLNGSRVLPNLSVLDGTGFLISDMDWAIPSSTVPTVASWGRGRFLAAYEQYDTTAAQIRARVRLVSDPVNGAKCATGAECTSGFCVDGVCCQSACTGGTCGGGVCAGAPARITCPADVVAEATGASGATVSYPPATATGTAPLTVTYSQGTDTLFAPGATTVTATVTDGLGGAASCTFSVTVRDSTAPSVSCPADVGVEASGPTGAAVSYTAPTATDAVTASPNVSVTHASGATFPLGTTEVTATARDEAGNTATCAFDITVRDTTAPSLTCPVDLTVDATSTSGANVTYPAATTSDSVSDVAVGYSAASGSHFDVGTTRVSVTATDDAGNSASCSFNVNVRLPSAPQLTCPVDVVAEATSSSGATVTYPAATATGTAPLTVTYDRESGALFALGTTTVTATVTDGLGRTETCTFSVTVRDTTAPSVSCPASLAAEATGPSGAAVSYTAPTATDAVTASPGISVSHASGGTFAIGTTEVAATATDGAGNTASCAFSITVRDTTAPSVSCPVDVTVEATSAEGNTISYAPATASDTASQVTLQYSHASGARFGVGTTQVTVTATDGFDNTASCAFTVTVRDSTPPTLTCGADLVAEATGATGASLDFAPPTAVDSVTAAPTVSVSHGSGGTFPIGTTQVTATATDAAGNSSTCTFNVTVSDTTAPEVGCPADVTAEAVDGSGAPVVFSASAPHDAVTLVPTVSVSHASGGVFAVGTTQVTLSATDEAGNTAACTFHVTVQDTTAPILSCPAGMAVRKAPPEGLTVDFLAATASDSVSPATVSYSHAPGSLFPVGATEVTATATDSAGNSATCSFEVRVSRSVTVSPPEELGWGCSTGSGPAGGLGWAAMLLLAWGVNRRRHAAR
ncbi:HYR domain-containing protein [Pyxidicoccus sp. 3LG]